MMKVCIFSLAAWLIASPWALHAEEPPIVFARSGQKATMPVRGDVQSAALAAYEGIGEPVAVKNHAAEFVAPRVRVPSVFRLVSPREGRAASLPGELVVYPAPIYREEHPPQFVAAAAPDWFNAWCDAAGVPARKFPTLKSLVPGNWRMLEKPGLLIVGKQSRGESPSIPWQLAAEYKINVLVLENDWFDANETAGREMTLSPKQMLGPLSDLQTRNWFPPPAFQQPAVRILNRQTWIAGAEHPLVEEIRGRERGTETLRTVCSYLPWQKQLGRCEAADELFLRLLSETAKGASDRRPLDGRWRLLWPAVKEVKAEERPVIAAALKSAAPDDIPDASGIRLHIVDLRGKSAPPAEFFEAAGPLKKIESRIGPLSPLLILGDHPALDEQQWLKLDRAGRRSSRPGVLWLPDVDLPAAVKDQLRLMEYFTEYNIFLGD